MTIMTPEEILIYGKRVVLFPEKGSKAHKIYYVQDGHLVRFTKLWTEGVPVDIYHSPVEIGDIYHLIERVYSKKSKGILIARRSGNRESHLPLKKTGKGIGVTVKKMNTLALYEQLNLTEEKVRQNARNEFKKAKSK